MSGLSGLVTDLEPFVFLVRQRTYHWQTLPADGLHVPVYERITDVDDLIRTIDSVASRLELRSPRPQFGSEATIGVVVRMYADAFSNPDDRPFQGPAPDARYVGDHAIRVHGRRTEDLLFTHNRDGWSSECAISTEYLRRQLVEAWVELGPFLPHEGGRWYPGENDYEVGSTPNANSNPGYERLSDDGAPVTLYCRRSLSANLQDRIFQVVAAMPCELDPGWPPTAPDGQPWMGKEIIVGWALFRAGDAGVVLEDVFVHPSYRQRGVATALVYGGVFNLVLLYGPHTPFEFLPSPADQLAALNGGAPPLVPAWLSLSAEEQPKVGRNPSTLLQFITDLATHGSSTS